MRDAESLADQRQHEEVDDLAAWRAVVSVQCWVEPVALPWRQPRLSVSLPHRLSASNLPETVRSVHNLRLSLLCLLIILTAILLFYFFLFFYVILLFFIFLVDDAW